MGEPEMACQELVEVITDYLEGALSADDRRRFERHLDGCDGCRTYLEQMRTAIRLTGMVRADDLSPGFRQKLLDAFRGWRRDGGIGPRTTA